MTKSRLDLPPGISKANSAYSSGGRYIDSQWVRFYAGKPQKIAGWIKWMATKLTGVPRGLCMWQQHDGDVQLAIGTHRKLYIAPDSTRVPQNITPVRAGLAAGADPISVTSGSKVVTITVAGYNAQVGDDVDISLAAAVGGITIDGEYTIVSVVSSSQFRVEHTVAATSTATGGGSSVFCEFEIAPGTVNSGLGTGYGTGRYGRGTYGTKRASTASVIKKKPRLWWLENYGQDLLAMPTGGTLYHKAAAATGRASSVANAPEGAGFILSETRHVMMFGCDGDPMLVRWCDQSDFTIWAASSVNTAGSRRLNKGNEIVSAASLNNVTNLFWTDTHLFEVQFTGGRFTWTSYTRASHTGLLAAKARTIAKGMAFWMSPNGFLMYNGGVSDIPNQNEVVDYVYDDINLAEASKVICWYNSVYNEVWWNYPAANKIENTKYVAVSLDDFTWITGNMGRSAVANEFKGLQKPILASQYGRVFEHETGLNGDGVALISYIETAPIDFANGDQLIDVAGFIPDFKRQAGRVVIDIKGYNYPNRNALMEFDRFFIEEGQGIEDLRLNARAFALRYTSKIIDGDFRLGSPRLITEANGDR
jgi:hypothetical protein